MLRKLLQSKSSCENLQELEYDTSNNKLIVPVTRLATLTRYRSERLLSDEDRPITSGSEHGPRQEEQQASADAIRISRSPSLPLMRRRTASVSRRRLHSFVASLVSDVEVRLLMVLMPMLFLPPLWLSCSSPSVCSFLGFVDAALLFLVHSLVV